jgi:chorismate mutase
MLIETVQEMLAPLAEGLPMLPEEPTMDDLEPWRICIDALDRAIIRLMNERVICANVIGQIKKRSDVPVYDPGREKKVLLNVQRHNDGPLSDEAVRLLFERIIDETRAVERQRYQQIKDEPEDK